MELFDKIIKIIKSPKFYGPVLIIIISLIIYNMVSGFINKITIKGKTELEKKKRKTLVLLFTNIFKYIIVLIDALMVLDIFGVNTTSILAGLGIAGVVIGLALQDALKDIISGINIIMDNYYMVGDLVKYGDFTGYIESLGLKSTKITGFNNDTLTVANRNIDKIINLSQKKAIIYLSIPTAYESKFEKCEKAINKALDEIKKFDYVVSNETKFLGINELASSSVNYYVQIKCDTKMQYACKRAFLKLIKEQYEKDNIKIPYNQIEVHHGSDI